MKKRMSNSNAGTMAKELSDGIKNLLGKQVKILFKCTVKLESKGDKTESRVLVLCPCRFFCLKVPPRIDFHFHYLEIQAIESKKPNQLMLTANDRSHSFVIPDDKGEHIDRIIVTLLTSLKETFPGIPLFNILKRIDVVPAKRLQHLDFTFDGGSTGSGSAGSSATGTATTTPVPYPKSKSTCSLEENALVSPLLSFNHSGSALGSSPIVGSAVVGDRCTQVTPLEYRHLTSGNGTIGPCGGFSVQYAWMCDFHGLPYREEVAWDVDTIYLSHDSRELCLHDFDHLESRDLVPILSALEYNTWFKSLRSSHVKLTHEAMDRLLHVVRKSLTIEELHVDNVGAKTDFALKLSAALSHNTNSQVHTIDLSHNMIEDKGAISLSTPLAKLCRGPVWLNLSQCGLSAKGVAQLAHALVLNRCAPSSLIHLNLSGNSLKEDINNLCNFLAQPNSINFLDLSGTDCTLETVFGALLRGCTTHLAHLNLSRNNFATKKGKEIPPSFKQYLTSSLALKHLSLSSCKLSLEVLKQLLLGLACNESTAELELDISSNVLGQQGAHVLESCLHGIKCLASLDISDNNLEIDLAGVVTAASKNKSLRHLNLGRNLQSTKAKHIAQVMDAIVQMLQEEDCVLQTLSLADSKLKGELYSVINALGSNQCLHNIDICGNQMGDVGARLLAKALQINSKIRSVTYDRNNITLQGFADIAYGLESNTSVRYMPYPIHDALPCMKNSCEKTEAVLKRIQDLVYRNSIPKKTTNGQQAFRLQQGFLLSSAQLTMDKLISQTQEEVTMLKNNVSNNQSSETNKSEVIKQAENLIQDSEKAKQILLSLHQMIEQKGEDGKILEFKLQQLSDDLHTMLSQHIQMNITNVLELTEEKCPHLMADNNLKEEIKQGCLEKSIIDPEYVRHCVMDMAGTDIVTKLNEVHLAVAAHISDKLVDRAIDSLMKCHKQLIDISKKRSSTPDVLKTRFRASPSDGSKDLETVSMLYESGSSHQYDQSPMATPLMHSKRKGIHGRRIRPKSVVDCVEGISADDIPDLLPSLPKTIEESISSLQDLPPVSPQQLKHLGKARPKKPKTRAPTRPCLRPSTKKEEAGDMQEGLETFFRPGSTTPTPIVTPDSDDCSTSLMISIDESIQSTPTHSSITYKVDDSASDKTSPGSFDSCSISSKLSLDPVPRSKSTDCLEKPSSVRDSLFVTGGCDEGKKSPVQRLGTRLGTSVVADVKNRKEGPGFDAPKTDKAPSLTSPGSSVSEAKEKFSKSPKVSLFGAIPIITRRPPPVAPKPRPWSVVGSESRSGSDGTSPNASAANTPESGDPLDDDVMDDVTKGPLDLNITNAATEKRSSAPGSTTSEMVSLSSSCASPCNFLLNNQNQMQVLSIANPLNSESNFDTSGSICNNVRKSNTVNNGNDHACFTNHSSSSVSLPWVGGVEKRSVRELAACLSQYQSAKGSDAKKKYDSLPKNVSAPSAEQHQESQQMGSK